MNILHSDNMVFTDSDRPVDEVGGDEYGFVEMARRIAPALLDSLNNNGAVIGIEGVWGSGKTSLLNFVIDEVKRLKSTQVEVISLAPWLTGDNDSMVTTLLDRIAESVESPIKASGINGVASLWRGRRKDGLAELLRRYGVKTGRAFSPALKLAGVVVPGLAVAGEAAAIGANALEVLGKAPTNAQLKEEIAKRLKLTNARYVVVLDDLDRLEPAQAVEVIRLVRSVADFPNILYLMCYDRKVLARALERGLDVEDGSLFLRKIVQQAFAIPLPEPFDLRLNFIKHAIAFFESVHSRKVTQIEFDFIESSVSEWGRKLRTPRDVKLALNGVRFYYTPVANDVNFADVCSIQLIKILEPKMYSWLEEYMGVMSVIVTGDGRAVKGERVRMGQQYSLLFNEDPDSPPARWVAAKLLPGLTKIKSEDVAELVYGRVEMSQLKDFVDERRVGSPFHYRYYFALAPVRTALTDAEYGNILRAATDGPAKASELIVDLFRREQSVGGNWLSQLFTRLGNAEVEQLAGSQIQSLVIAIADIMDVVLAKEQEGRASHLGPPREAELVVKHLLKALTRRSEAQGAKCTMTMLHSSSSVTWLAGYLMRSEMRKHQPSQNSRDVATGDCLLSSDYIEEARSVLLGRIEFYTNNDAFHTSPDLASLLFGWRDLGPHCANDARDWVSKSIASDTDFVDFLLKMRSWAMSDHVYFPLHRGSLECFVEVADIDHRLQHILESHENGSVKEKARTVIKALEYGRDLT